MFRYLPLTLVLALTALAAASPALGRSQAAWWLIGLLPLSLIGLYDLFQRRHSILRNYPLLGHFRWIAEGIRPEIHQYFVESDTDGAPFDRNARSLVYEQAKGVHQELPFGTELDVYQEGYEWFPHSLHPGATASEPFRVQIGGEHCKKPYDMALLNVSAMSFGALSSAAIRALNRGARLGGFAHDTGEGGLSQYHLKEGGDLVWEIGSGYFGCRTSAGHFDLEQFADKASHENVKCVSLKLSQGAKPGLGGVMPAAKVTQEIATIRGVPAGQKCVSPPFHSAFSTPRELVELIHTMRERSEGKPAGFKLCVGRHRDFFGILKAMLELETAPDFIIVDGSEGGTGAAPLEFEDRVGMPLTDGLVFVHNALVGAGLRDRIRIGASGKIHSGFTMASRIAQGADYTNSARAMMFALGCIQAQRCHTNTCPVGVATQDPRRVRALVVPEKAERVSNFQRNTCERFRQILGALGLDSPAELTPAHLMRRVSSYETCSYGELYEWLSPGELVDGSDRESWAREWAEADPSRFR